MLPKPDSGDPPRIFTPDYYQRMRDLESRSWWNAGMRDVATQLLGIAALSDTGRALDVGCGSGQSLRWFASLYPRWEGMGLDVAIDGVMAARTFGVGNVMRASALALPVQSSAVDLVMTFDVLQHLPLEGGDRQALAEIHRVLRLDGHLLLRTNAQAFPRAVDDPVYNFHKYEPAELRHKLEQSGFEIIRLGRLNALLGLAEIPPEWRALDQPHSYHGLLSNPRREKLWLSKAKRAWLRAEGRVIARGASWPLGRTIFALCKRGEI